MALINETLGSYVSHRFIASGIEIAAENAVVELQLYSDAICRVCIVKSGQRRDGFSYAVVKTPEAVDFQLEDRAAALEIRTRCFRLTIEKNPLRLSFQTPEGQMINADDPAFGTSWIGDEASTYKSLQPHERFLGLGEKTGSLDRAGSAYIHWNTDYFGYPVDADPLYKTFPFYIGAHSGLCYGIFLDSTCRSTFNFGASNNRFSFFSVEGGIMDYYFVHDASIPAVLKEFTDLVGRMPMPPLWSLGYQQCRFSYSSEVSVKNVARGFRERDIPADVIYLDIHYMAGFRMFTWDAKHFPAPREMIGQLKKAGFHVAAILDPGIKIEPGYAPYEDGLRQDVFLKYPDGELYAGEVWPGWCHFPDFTRPQTRQWWAGWLKELADAGIEGFWNDMNEPSAWGQNIPNLVEFDYEGRKAAHKCARNVYGMQMAVSSYEGAVQWLANRRPFVLTRAGYMGVQRYSAVWTGDNVSDDAHMLNDVMMVNSMGLTGVPFCGYDIGGFAGECTPDLFARWISIGVFAPFARGHTMVNSRDAEPWSFGEHVEGIARNYIKLRYRLLPYIYSLFDECVGTGLPVCRSLAIDAPQNPKVYEGGYQSEFLFGPHILVVPVASGERRPRIYLPEGRWYDLYTDQMFDGETEILWEASLEKLPLFVRAGAVIPMQAPVACTRDVPAGPLELHLYAVREGGGGFSYYEDDGSSFDYLNGAFFRRSILQESDQLLISPAKGQYKSRFKELKLFFHGFDFTDRAVIHLNGGEIDLQAESLRIFEPVSPFARDGAAEDPYGQIPVFTATVAHSSREMRFTF